MIYSLPKYRCLLHVTWYYIVLLTKTSAFQRIYVRREYSILINNYNGWFDVDRNWLIVVKQRKFKYPLIFNFSLTRWNVGTCDNRREGKQYFVVSFCRCCYLIVISFWSAYDIVYLLVCAPNRQRICKTIIHLNS